MKKIISVVVSVLLTALLAIQLFGDSATGQSANTVIITRDYTRAQSDEAEGALAAIMKTLYLDEESEEYKAIAKGVVEEDAVIKYAYDIYTLEYVFTEKMTPLFDTIVPVYRETITEIADSGEFEPEPVTSQNTLLYYEMLFTDTALEADGEYEYYGKRSFYTDTKTYENAGGVYYRSAYALNDFKTHAVDIYRLLKDSKLDLQTASAKYVQVSDFGAVYYLADGTNEYVMTIGVLSDMTPLLEDFEITRENMYDAATYLGLYTVEEFIETAKTQMAAMKAIQSPDGESETGGLPGVAQEPETADTIGPVWVAVAFGAAALLILAAAILIRRQKRT